MRTYKLTIRQPDDSTRHERIRAASRSEAVERAELCLKRGKAVIGCKEV